MHVGSTEQWVRHGRWVKGKPLGDARQFFKSQPDGNAVLLLSTLCKRNAFFQDFAEDAIITTALGQQLTDLKKFEDAIKKYEGVQTAAKKLVR